MTKNVRLKLLAIVTAIAVAVTMTPAIAFATDGVASSGIKLQAPVVKDGVSTWDCIYFGNYPQSDTTGDKKDPIKWRVLRLDGNEALIFADMNLDVVKYNEDKEAVTWENSSLRKWLNEDFYNSAFSGSEKNAIKEFSAGNGVKDNVSIPSTFGMTSTDFGFTSDDKPTSTRAVKNTAFAESKKADGFYWLRTDGETNKPDQVHGSGGIYREHFDIDGDKTSVRPVVLIDVSQDCWNYAGFVSSDGIEKEPGKYYCSSDNKEINSMEQCQWKGDKIKHTLVCKEHDAEGKPANVELFVDRNNQKPVVHEAPDIKGANDPGWIEKCELSNCPFYWEAYENGMFVCFKGDASKEKCHLTNVSRCSWIENTQDGELYHVLACKNHGETVIGFNETTGFSEYVAHLSTQKAAGCTLCAAAAPSGNADADVKVTVKGTSIKKLSKARKAFTVKWKKQSAKVGSSHITGYQVRYDTKKSMENAKIKTVKGYKKTSKRIKKLKGKKKYYVQVRTYKEMNGKTYYSNWSAKKSVKTR